MRVKNYEEWYQAVNAEHRKLSEMSHYLNEKGVERMQAFGTLGNLEAFGTLGNLADFCATPQELVAWIDSKEGLDKCDVANLESAHIMPAISTLRRIAKAGEEVVSP